MLQAPYRGTLKTTLGIAREEGVLKLWQGIHAQFLRHLVYSGTRIVTYRALKENVFKHNTNESSYYPVWKSALCKPVRVLILC